MSSFLLSHRFFQRPTLLVARQLLGKFIVENTAGKIRGHLITEVEAYDGPEDLASHAAKGKTERNAPMFGEAGVWYVYFIYGMHYMLNIVTGKEQYPAAVLIRGIQHADGHLLNGPAKLTKSLRIDKKWNNLRAEPQSGLWVEDRGVIIKDKDIEVGPRIGVDYAGVWAGKPYRFFLKKEWYEK